MTNTKQYSLLQLFSLVDGRLSTSMDDVHDMLGYICRFDGIMTHHLPTAHKYLKANKPEWWNQVEADLRYVQEKVGNDFNNMITYIKDNNKTYDISQIPEEDEQSFGNYMVDNSLLNTIGSKR